MKYALIADDGQARVVVEERENAIWPSLTASEYSEYTSCKWHVCRREPSENGHHLVTLETWEKGVKL